MKMETNNNFELQEAFDLFDTDGDGQVIEFVFIEFCSQTFAVQLIWLYLIYMAFVMKGIQY